MGVVVMFMGSGVIISTVGGLDDVVVAAVTILVLECFILLMCVESTVRDIHATK